MNYKNLTVEKLAEYCYSKSDFKINKADLETQIHYLIDKEVSKQLNLNDVGVLFTDEEAENVIGKAIFEAENPVNIPNTDNEYYKRFINCLYDLGYKIVRL